MDNKFKDLPSSWRENQINMTIASRNCVEGLEKLKYSTKRFMTSKLNTKAKLVKLQEIIKQMFQDWTNKFKLIEQNWLLLRMKQKQLKKNY